MQDNYSIVISDQELDNLDSAIKYRQQIIDLVNAGQPEIIIYFSRASQCPNTFLDILFRDLIRQYGHTWFINSRIMVDADNGNLKKKVTDFIIDVLQSAMQNEEHSAVTETLIVTKDNWQQLPVLKGRVATEEDVNNNDAVFFINPEQAEVNIVDIALPKCGIYTNENNEQIPVIIVQAEQFGNNQIIGMYSLDGTKIVGQLSEVKFIEPEILFG